MVVIFAGVAVMLSLKVMIQKKKEKMLLNAVVALWARKIPAMKKKSKYFVR